MYRRKNILRAGVLALITLMAWSTAAYGDWIRLNGATHQDVYINETRTMYFVHFPDTGEVMNVPKNSVSPDNVGFNEDAAFRTDLLEAWRERNPERERTADRLEDVRQHQRHHRASAPPPNTAEQPTQRVQQVSLGGDALPKIVLRNPPLRHAPTGMQRPNTMMRQPQQQFGGGMGTGTRGMPGTGGMGTGMRGMPGTGGMAGMGGMGMPGMGGMMPGMGGMAMRDVTVISNISDLFSNIDDRLVGEPLAEIHPSYIFHQRQEINMRDMNHRNRR